MFTIIGILTIIYIIIRLIILICLSFYNKVSNKFYQLKNNQIVDYDTDAWYLIPTIEIGYSTNYVWIYCRWLCFYYYIDYSFEKDE